MEVAGLGIGALGKSSTLVSDLGLTSEEPLGNADIRRLKELETKRALLYIFTNDAVWPIDR